MNLRFNFQALESESLLYNRKISKMKYMHSRKQAMLTKGTDVQSSHRDLKQLLRFRFNPTIYDFFSFTLFLVLVLIPVSSTNKFDLHQEKIDSWLGIEFELKLGHPKSQR